MDRWPKTFVCVAGGPSLTLQQVRYIGIARAIDLCRVIAINDAIYPCWFADIGYASDLDWWNTHRNTPRFEGVRYSIRNKEHKAHRLLRLLEGNNKVNGYVEAPNTVSTGGNSGHAAVHLAADLGAERIVLVAYDFQGDSRGNVVNHWFGKHKGHLYKEGENQQDHRLVAFRALTDDLQKRKIQIVNCSRESRIGWLPRMTLEQAIPHDG